MAEGLTENVVDKQKSDIYVDIEIEKLFDGNIGLKKKNLLIELANRTGRSIRTINRILKKLKKNGRIFIVKGRNALQEYGITESDDRYAYVLSNKIKSTKELIDYAFNLIQKGSEGDKKTALIEIDDEKMITLSPNKIDILVKQLRLKDKEEDATIIRILSDQLYYKKARAGNQELLIQTMKKALQKYCTAKQGEEFTTRNYALQILAIYKDKAVIEEIKRDIYTRQNIDQTGSEYSGQYMAEVIEEYKKDLFELQRELMNKGLEKQSKFIKSLRNNARNFLQPYKLGWNQQL